MNVGIIGASGYSGEELVRLLARHPRVTLARVTSRSLAGRRLAEVMPALREKLEPTLAFTASEPGALADDETIQTWFLALPHGVAAEFARPLVEAGKRVIDLSADFRLGSPSLYQSYYGRAHPAPDLLERARYVIPEIHPLAEWREARLLACPGCYPTGILVPLYPLIRERVLAGSRIVCNSFSGVSGAGRKVDEAYLYCQRNESARAYGMPRHRHLSEIEEQLGHAAGGPVVLQFNPHLAPMSRGILTTITAPAGGHALEALHACWEKAYADRPFVNILPAGSFPDTAHVSRTNRVDISAVHDERTGNFILSSAEDNLVKGASGQAVQIMNLAHGFEETAGLL